MSSLAAGVCLIMAQLFAIRCVNICNEMKDLDLMTHDSFPSSFLECLCLQGSEHIKHFLDSMDLEHELVSVRADDWKTEPAYTVNE